MSTYITDSKIISAQPSTLGGIPAYSLRYTGRQGNSTLNFDAIYALKQGRAYILIGTAPLAAQNKYTPLFQGTFKRFKWTR